jgi:hypothetical protein
MRIDLDNLHFCKESKVKYRKHLTFGMFLSLVMTLAGIHWSINWLAHSSAVANFVTSVIWIWE